MAKQKQSVLDAIIASPLYNTVDFPTNENLNRENFKKTINKRFSRMSSKKNLIGDDKSSSNRTGRRQIKRSIKKAIALDSISLLYPVCRGVDVHKDIMVACLRTVNKEGEKLKKFENSVVLPTI